MEAFWGPKEHKLGQSQIAHGLNAAFAKLLWPLYSLVVVSCDIIPSLQVVVCFDGFEKSNLIVI